MQARDDLAKPHLRSILASVMQGKALLAGTRVMVPVILDNIAAGMPREEILRSYPSIRDGDIGAALQYAAELTRERIVPLSASA